MSLQRKRSQSWESLNDHTSSSTIEEKLSDDMYMSSTVNETEEDGIWSSLDDHEDSLDERSEKNKKAIKVFEENVSLDELEDLMKEEVFLTKKRNRDS